MHSCMMKLIKERLNFSIEFLDMSSDFDSSKCADEVYRKLCFEK